MLVFPMSSPSSSPSRQRATSPYMSRMQREESPQTLELRKKVASTMLSAITPSSPPNPKRPKLSLQTSLGSSRPSSTGRISRLGEGPESPTARNTAVNTFEAPSPTPSSTVTPKAAMTMMNNAIANSPLAASSHGHISPFPHGGPYNLPLGTHSILRNSPLPKPQSSATSTRAPRRIFSLRKEVKFREGPEDHAPTPILEASEGEENSAVITEEQREERRRAIEQEDGHSTASHRRRKKRREWIWRPMHDDILLEHGVAEESQNY